MLKNISGFFINKSWQAPCADDMNDALRSMLFQPCAAGDERQFGFCRMGADLTNIDKSEDPFKVIGWQLFFQYVIQTKTVPAAVVKDELAKRCREIEEREGVKVKGQRKKELKEDVRLSLLPRAFAKTTCIPVVIDLAKNVVLIGTTSTKALDEVIGNLVRVLSLANEAPELSFIGEGQEIRSKFSLWLNDGEVNEDFTIDRSLTLELPGSSTRVKYEDHNLDIDEVREHLAQGKVPVSLALTYDSQISFELNTDLHIKKIKFLEISKTELEGMVEDPTDKEQMLDAELTLGGMALVELVKALDRTITQMSP